MPLSDAKRGASAFPNGLSVDEKRQTFFDLIFLILASAFFLFFRLGGGSLASWDEAIYATVAKEIFRSGHWLQLTLDGAPWTDKPPLCIWATALCYRFFGVNEFSARFFSAACGFGLIVVTYCFGKLLFGRRTGFLGALVFLSSLHFLRVARFGVMDAPLTFFISLALYFFWIGRGRNGYLILSGLFFGFAVMTKSFAALPVVLIAGLYLFFAKEKNVLAQPSGWIALAVAAAIALPWSAYEGLTRQSVYLADGIAKNLILRTTGALDGHKGGMLFYLHVLFNKYRPWGIFAVIGAPLFLIRSFKEKNGPALFLTTWIFVVFLMVTLVRTKLDWYLFPIYPALSLCIGDFLARFLKNRLFIQAVFLIILLFQVRHAHVWREDYSSGIRAAAAKSAVPEGQEVYLYKYHETPAVSFYLSRRSRYLDDPSVFASAAGTAPRFYCFIQTKDLRDVEPLLSGLGVSVKAQFQDLTFLSKK